MTDKLDLTDPDATVVHVAQFSTVDFSSSADWEETVPMSIPPGFPTQTYILQVTNRGFPSWPFRLWASEPDSAGNPIEYQAPLLPSPATMALSCSLPGGWSANIHLEVATGGQPVPPGASLTLMLLLIEETSA